MTISADTGTPVEVEDAPALVEAITEVAQPAEAQSKSIACPEPGCDQTFETNQALGAHRRIHGYVSPNPKKPKGKAVVPATVKAMDAVLENMRNQLLEVLGGGTEVGRLTTENIRLTSELRQARADVEKIDRRHAAAFKKLQDKHDRLAERVQDAEKQWSEDEKLLEEIVRLLGEKAPLAAVAAITQALPSRLLPEES